MNCRDARTLLESLSLTETEQFPDLGNHLTRCEACRREVETLRRLEGMVREGVPAASGAELAAMEEGAAGAGSPRDPPGSAWSRGSLPSDMSPLPLRHRHVRPDPSHPRSRGQFSLKTNGSTMRCTRCRTNPAGPRRW